MIPKFIDLYFQKLDPEYLVSWASSMAGKEGFMYSVDHIMAVIGWKFSVRTTFPMNPVLPATMDDRHWKTTMSNKRKRDDLYCEELPEKYKFL